MPEIHSFRIHIFRHGAGRVYCYSGRVMDVVSKLSSKAWKEYYSAADLNENL